MNDFSSTNFTQSVLRCLDMYKSLSIDVWLFDQISLLVYLLPIIMNIMTETPLLATRPFLVIILWWETPSFDDENLSRHHFAAEFAIFWRRDPFSSSFWVGNSNFLMTKRNLVGILWWESQFFGDETPSRRHFEPRNPIFWRRNPFSSSFWAGNRHLLTTKRNLVGLSPYNCVKKE